MTTPHDDVPDIPFEGAHALRELPDEDAVHAGHDALRAAAAEQDRSADELPDAIRSVARHEADKRGRIGVLLAALLALAISLVATPYAVAARADADTAASAAAVSAGQASQARQQLAQANATLTGRGQTPVATPPASAPASDTISAAVLAKVLAQLPATPTADEVAAKLQAAVTANVVGPTIKQLSEQAGAYLSLLTPPGPTQAQIDAAVSAEYAANPPKDGKDGSAGAAGRSITAVATTGGHLVVSFSDGTTQDAGALPAGPAGAAGADSTVPGPAGPAGPAGQTGADGHDGKDGKDGAPPAGWSYTDALGGQHTCSRDTSSPDSAPTYTCN